MRADSPQISLHPDGCFQVCAYSHKFAPLEMGSKVSLNAREVPLTTPEDPITAQNAGRRLFTRVERQTVFRLPKSGAILFTVHTFVKPLHRLESQPEQACASDLNILTQKHNIKVDLGSILPALFWYTWVCLYVCR